MLAFTRCSHLAWENGAHRALRYATVQITRWNEKELTRFMSSSYQSLPLACMDQAELQLGPNIIIYCLCTNALYFIICQKVTQSCFLLPLHEWLFLSKYLLLHFGCWSLNSTIDRVINQHHFSNTHWEEYNSLLRILLDRYSGNRRYTAGRNEKGTIIVLWYKMRLLWVKNIKMLLRHFFLKFSLSKISRLSKEVL